MRRFRSLGAQRARAVAGGGNLRPRSLGAPIVTGTVDREVLARAARRPGADVGAADGPAVNVVVTVLNGGSARHARCPWALWAEAGTDAALTGVACDTNSSLPPGPVI